MQGARIILLAQTVICLSCNYHVNALDPQLQPPKSTDSGPSAPVADLVVADLQPDLGSAADWSVEEVVAGEVLFEVSEVAGCTDEDALNYDPEATADDGSCLFNVTLTFNLDMACVEVVETPQVAGGDNFGMPGDHPMADPDGDGIWTVQVTLPPALGTGYTYTNGACEDWSCKEQIGGQDCANPPYDDRYLNSGTEDHEINECFGQCGEGVCGDCLGG